MHNTDTICNFASWNNSVSYNANYNFMKKVYLIQCLFTRDELFSEVSLTNLYCVCSESVANDECHRLQTEREKLCSDGSLKYIYRYVELNLFVYGNTDKGNKGSSE